ncbi:MAG: polysaccharide deacetylase family protein [Bacteroidales bacterium]|nr:polysaccharide deacetylase family protein [Bacteroidales bacterium]
MQFTIIDKISKAIPFKILQSFGKPKVLPLLYHVVGDAQNMPYLSGLYNVLKPEDFEKDLEFLLKNYTPIDLESLVKYKQQNLLPGKKKYFFLSFDDGLRPCSEIIAPILLRKGIPATFFINTGFVGNQGFLHRFKAVLLSEAIRKDKSERLKHKLESFTNMQFSCRYKAANYVKGLTFRQTNTLQEAINYLEVDIERQLQDYRPYMSKDEIGHLVSKGFTVGAHSEGHPEFYLLTEEEQLQQAGKSVETLIEWFNLPYSIFAFPFTDSGVKKSFFEKFNEIYKPDLTFACAGLKNDPEKNHIQRIAMDNRYLQAENLLKSEYLHYFLKGLVGKRRVKRV